MQNGTQVCVHSDEVVLRRCLFHDLMHEDLEVLLRGNATLHQLLQQRVELFQCEFVQQCPYSSRYGCVVYLCAFRGLLLFVKIPLLSHPRARRYLQRLRGLKVLPSAPSATTAKLWSIPYHGAGRVPLFEAPAAGRRWPRRDRIPTLWWWGCNQVHLPRLGHIDERLSVSQKLAPDDSLSAGPRGDHRSKSPEERSLPRSPATSASHRPEADRTRQGTMIDRGR
mmetsp:Transcript_97526/g.244414  ORF Transcript_97526/g.244414 Transcript_97526/m.244414 type:complete len:224 (+) Transcript_97526:1358-2029(+)